MNRFEKNCLVYKNTQLSASSITFAKIFEKA